MHTGKTVDTSADVMPDFSLCRVTSAAALYLCSQVKVSLLAGTLVLGCCFHVPAQQQRGGKVGAPIGEFNGVAAKASVAREANRFDEAIALYRRAVTLRPRWSEGWWYLATLLYERDNHREATAAFKQAATLQPKAGAPWAMLGLCEFQLGHYDEALGRIQQGRQLGIGDNKELSRVIRYTESSLLLLKGEFEAAQKTLGTLSYDGLSSEGLVIAQGLAVLRIPMLPKQVNATSRDHELIRRAGWAEHLFAQKNFADAEREYERLAADFVKTPGVQYAHGRYLLASGNQDKAVAVFEHEIGNSPNHALARLQIAYIKMSNKDATSALPFAEEAVKLHPRLPLGQYLLGRLLFDAGQNDRAIAALESAERLAPNEPKVYFTLSRAYARANRKAEADRARTTFTRLNQQVEEAAQQGVNRAGAIQENVPETAPPTASP